MDIKNIILIMCVILFTSCKNHAQTVDKPIQSIYGKWEYVKHSWWKYGKYTAKQIDSLKNTILNVNSDEIYFENIKFIDKCSFSSTNIKTTKIFDKANEEYLWYEEGSQRLLPSQYTGPLALQYTKKELSKIEKIELGCKYGLSILYLKEDTLILNYLGGVTLFMTKVPFKLQTFTGTGNTTKELELTGKETLLKLTYDFYKEPDKLTIEDKLENVLFETKMIGTEREQVKEIDLSNKRNIEKLVFKIQTEKPSSKWKFKVEIK